MKWNKPHYNMPWYFQDMATREHILIGGSTGSGKSVALNGLMMYLLTKDPTEVKFILIDPKRVELRGYKNLPHTLRHAHTIEDISEALQFAERMMNIRFEAMEIQSEKTGKDVRKYWGSDIYIIIDEYASLTEKHASKREKEIAAKGMASLREVAYKGRATKIHIVACTQRPTQDVIEGMIQNNFTTVLALRTNKKIESRNLIELSWCEQLPDYGNAYYKTPSHRTPVKVETQIVPESLSEEVITHWLSQN